MRGSKKLVLGYRRRREGKTDYKMRLKLISSRKSRLVVRKFLNNFIVQFIDYTDNGDKTVVSGHTRELIKFGWKGCRGNIPAGYLVGLLTGLKAKKKGLKSAILDLGLARAVKGSGYFAVVKGILDAGLDINCNDKMLPSLERVSGKHIENYARELSKKNEKYEKQFSGYIKKGFKAEDMLKEFDAVKRRIIEKWQ